MNGRETMGQLAQRVRASLHKYRLVWLVILVGLFLLLLPTGGGEGEEAAAEPAQGTFDLEKTEARLAQALSQIKGAGEVTVMLTVANGPRQVLAQDVDRNSQQGEESTQTVILSRGSSSQETVTVPGGPGGVPRGRRPRGAPANHRGSVGPDGPGRR